MFLLVKISDVLEVEPAYFSPEHQPDRLLTLRAPRNQLYVPTLEDILWHRISERYVGMVVPECGLCVAVGDLVSHSNSTIRGNDASSWTTVVFEVVVFRPAVNERLRAKISRQTEKGIYLSVEFFQNIFVPSHFLLQPSVFDDVAGAWYLQITEDVEDESQDGVGSSSGQQVVVARNLYKNDDEVLVSIWNVTVKSQVDHVALSSVGEGLGNNTSPDSNGVMTVTGTFLEPGLGPCAWFS